ncbi:MobC family plasmid mobilization relaxosome protein [Mucilaginibacter rubeus]|uniref:MobC family plasmid mobilization relaxosome protein n=1 Tax=Mucilaginibacter rubeus TaxID=2027860 RepID=A0AAE6JLG8_9SPHI|nr:MULTISPECIES: plasmid mobilization relaxosome protein MobC [Mucilaginibacter]QEM07841.1 MobC family plasmid mobilization relaxosome protein [Mucilaginibacter rubeus]QEM20293.1 MobC family plasmid mobilization relaxosome protein [Mucilaginibacter gossypii]QTE42989.1 plasmid mobilization relaxosome protein MobC [Mucilaginibacter rubeus]QTE49590.1 plasmid mobilization relaxosome protein MobC [Mucilaginibacter rubeus]QTE54686.1 plasmid mobilization relaxosome protein MobC [Mucilaginibacter rube
MTRNKGGRPPVGDDRRSFKIDVRFTEAEYRQVERLEKELGLKKTELVRRKLLSEGKGLAVNAAELMKRLDAVSLELSRSGNNINQLARYANRLQKRGLLSVAIIDEYLHLLRRHQNEQNELAMLFRKLIRSLIP